MSGMYSLSLNASALLRNSRYVSAGSPGSPVAARTSAASSALRYTHPSRPWPSARQAPSCGLLSDSIALSAARSLALATRLAAKGEEMCTP